MGYTEIDDFVLDQLLGYQTMNLINANIIAAVSRRSHSDLGGSLVHGIRSASYVPVVDRRHIKDDGTNYGGFTKRLQATVYTEEAATTVQVKLRNLTTPADATAESTASGSLTAVDITPLDITIANGESIYELQVKGLDANADVFALGYREIFAP